MATQEAECGRHAMLAGENTRVAGDRDQGGPGLRQTGDHAAHTSNPWHHPRCRQGRGEDGGSLACLVGPAEVASHLVSPSQIAMDKVWKQRVTPVFAFGFWSWT